MAATTTAIDPTSPQSLANADLPKRVRRVLEILLNIASDELDHPMGEMLSEFEQQLFRMADNARNPGIESDHLQTLRTLRMNRADLLPRFMAGLEASVAGIGHKPAQDAAATTTATAISSMNLSDLSLVEQVAIDEDAVLREIASRQESRNTLTLHLFGQRFGVLAGAPAFDAQRIPLGPQSLCSVMRDAAQSLQVSLEARLLLYRIFERRVMAHYPQLLESLNASATRNGILPSLTYVPIRLRPSAQPADEVDEGAEEIDDGVMDGVASSQHNRPQSHGTAAKTRGRNNASRPGAGTGASGAHAAGGQGAGAQVGGMPSRTMHAGRVRSNPAEHDNPQRPFTAWPGEALPATDTANETEAFDQLQQLLTGRRELLDKLRPDKGSAPQRSLDRPELLEALSHLKHSQSSTGALRSLPDIKQTLLAQARQKYGHAAGLQREDNDTFELLDMVYGQLQHEIRSNSAAAALLQRLQLPLLQVALKDRAFFVRAQHPARELLNTVAESGARWLGEGDIDPQMLAPMKQAVDHVVEKYDGDDVVFEESNKKLQGELHTLVHKAELSERRLIDAARGKEKLEIAKRKAAETIQDLIGERRLPKFIRALLNQAWADVLTLTLLRQGSESDEWKQQLDATRRIIDACAQSGSGTDADPELATHIETALSQVGYHGEEAAEISRRLTSANTDDDSDDTATRTELAMKLRARTRLGEDAQAKAKPKLPPRSPAEQERYEQLRVIPYGTWFEFITNQQGNINRRRLSWYSPMTEHALFVNQRGQRVAETTLDALARMLASGQVKIVTAERGHMVDRAWQATLSALRSFAGHGGPAKPAGAPA